jgi:hypothetical protein
VKVFHHNDADGCCAAFWVAEYYGRGDKYDTYIRLDYGMPFPVGIVEPGEEVWIVDYSIEPEEMVELLGITAHVHWFDHHKTAIEKYADFPMTIPGVRQDGKSGCRLVAEYILEHVHDATPDPPAFVLLIDDWDVWKHEYPQTRAFMAALTAEDYDPLAPIWLELLWQHTPGWREKQMVEQGEHMLRFRAGWAGSYMELGFETLIDDHRAFAVNLGRCNSDYFESLEGSGYEIYMPFVFDGDMWHVSLYSTTVDVSEIALQEGPEVIDNAPIKLEREFVYVVAGNYQQFLRWCYREKVLSTHPDPQGRRAVYVVDTYTLYGVHDPLVAFTGTWDQRPDALRILDEIHSHNFQVWEDGAAHVTSD